MLTRTSQTNWQTLGAGIDPYNPAFQTWLGATGERLSDAATMPIVAMEVMRQATLLGFIETFGFVTLSFLLLIPLVLLLKRTSGPVQFGFSGAPSDRDTAKAGSKRS